MKLRTRPRRLFGAALRFSALDWARYRQRQLCYLRRRRRLDVAIARRDGRKPPERPPVNLKVLALLDTMAAFAAFFDRVCNRSREAIRAAALG